MNRDDIIRMAREAWLGGFLEPHWDLSEELERFAALVAAAERERCAQICDSVAANAVLGTANECARAIRNQLSTAQNGQNQGEVR